AGNAARATASGVSAGGFSVGTSAATATLMPWVAAWFGTGVTVQAGRDVSISARGNVDPFGQPLANTASASATTSGGALLAAPGALALATPPGTPDAAVGGNPTVNAGGNVSLSAQGANAARATANGSVFGLIAGGGSVATATDNSTTTARV